MRRVPGQAGKPIYRSRLGTATARQAEKPLRWGSGSRRFMADCSMSPGQQGPGPAGLVATHLLVFHPSESAWPPCSLTGMKRRAWIFVHPCFCSKAASWQASYRCYAWQGDIKRSSSPTLGHSMQLMLTSVTSAAPPRLPAMSWLRPKWVWSGWQHSQHHGKWFHHTPDEEQMVQKCPGMTGTCCRRPQQTLLIQSLAGDVPEQLQSTTGFACLEQGINTQTAWEEWFGGTRNFSLWQCVQNSRFSYTGIKTPYFHVQCKYNLPGLPSSWGACSKWSLWRDKVRSIRIQACPYSSACACKCSGKKDTECFI